MLNLTITDHFKDRLKERYGIEYSDEFKEKIISSICSIDTPKSICIVNHDIYIHTSIDYEEITIALYKTSKYDYTAKTVIKQFEKSFLKNVMQKMIKGGKRFQEEIKNLEEKQLKVLNKTSDNIQKLKNEIKLLKDKIYKIEHLTFYNKLRFLFSKIKD